MGGFSYSQKTSVANILQQLLPKAEQQRQKALEREQAAQLAAQQAYCSTHAILWASLARKAIVLNETPALKVWMAAHHLNRQANGSGILPTDKPGLQELANLCGLSTGYLRVVLKDYDGSWWQRLPDARLRIFSQAAMTDDITRRARAQNLADWNEPETTRLALPLEILATNLEAFQGAIFAAWLGKYKGRGLTITWAALKPLWAARGTLRRWIEAAGIFTRRNAAFDSLPDNLQDIEIEDLAEALGFGHCWQPPTRPDLIFYERGKTYRGKDMRHPRPGRRSKLNRRIDKCAGTVGPQGRISDSALRARPEQRLGPDAGQLLSERLEHASKGRGMGAALEAWSKLVAHPGGRIVALRTNFTDGKSAVKASRSRPDEIMHQLVSEKLAWSGTSWGIWRRFGDRYSRDSA